MIGRRGFFGSVVASVAAFFYRGGAATLASLLPAAQDEMDVLSKAEVAAARTRSLSNEFKVGDLITIEGRYELNQFKPCVDGWQNAGAILNTRGWPPNCDLLKMSETVQIWRYHVRNPVTGAETQFRQIFCVTSDARSDENGRAALRIHPSLRLPVGDGVAIAPDDFTCDRLGVERMKAAAPSVYVIPMASDRPRRSWVEAGRRIKLREVGDG